MRTQDLKLHDATLKSITFEWREALCILELRTSEEPHCKLIFSAVTHIAVPRNQPWGPSVSINEFREKQPGSFEIELQSGDVIEVKASNFLFEPMP